MVREAAGKDAWPDDFVLQEVIDYRYGKNNFFDDLPTTEDVARRYESRQKVHRLRLPQRPNIDFPQEAESGDPAADDTAAGTPSAGPGQ